MKIFLIGGNALDSSEPAFAEHEDRMRSSSRRFGKAVATAGHDLIVCSGFQGSADAEAFAAASGLLTENSEVPTRIEFYFPQCPAVASIIESLIPKELVAVVSRFPQPATLNSARDRPTSHDWLVAQLVALDQCNAVVAIGGKPDAAASVLLRLAESTCKPILPYLFLGGAAGQSFQRLQYRLRDKLGSKICWLSEPEKTDACIELIEDLEAEGFTRNGPTCDRTFFISYPRARPNEADHVEMILRRRNFVVHRDERDFSAGAMLQGEIDSYIHRSAVFVALWSQEYACSPWCHDELELALELQSAGELQVWLLCVDNTRIVPKGARKLVSYPAVSREELEHRVMLLIEQLN